jgi:hypothetical protein
MLLSLAVCLVAICHHSMELYGDDLMEFFQRVEVANFEIASDAFSSFKVRSSSSSSSSMSCACSWWQQQERC